MALANRSLAPNAETVFITADPQNMYVSSSLIRQIAGFGGDVSDFVPKNIVEEIEKRLK
jgi:pantetheine-phosphate adenylyltransferase